VGVPPPPPSHASRASLLERSDREIEYKHVKPRSRGERTVSRVPSPVVRAPVGEGRAQAESPQTLMGRVRRDYAERDSRAARDGKWTRRTTGRPPEPRRPRLEQTGCRHRPLASCERARRRKSAGSRGARADRDRERRQQRIRRDGGRRRLALGRAASVGKKHDGWRRRRSDGVRHGRETRAARIAIASPIRTAYTGTGEGGTPTRFSVRVVYALPATAASDDPQRTTRRDGGHRADRRALRA